ncbi:unnamed protein product [Gongylonema pulchrum]|uniref:non-specific serine/threonine protein kinase n=1 Tax=Gongylonema pulchrum TaxID=637853 RepID=A0A183EMA7_9BILA|nr:unnamed protein product [Gongylonema pulchrum]
MVDEYCALKVYKMTLSQFKNRSEYVQDDYRFKNPRRVLRVWAEKEFTNLNRMVRGGVKCPEPIRLRKHIMIMSFIGSDGIAARKLKDVEWNDPEIIHDAFLQVKTVRAFFFFCIFFEELKLFRGFADATVRHSCSFPP